MELTIEQALEQGVAAHKAGKFQEAERLYRVVLQSQPSHPDANYNLGLLAVHFNKADVALPLFKTAIETNPKKEKFWLSYIDVLIKENQFDNAQQALQKAERQRFASGKLGSFKERLATIPKVKNTNSASPSRQQINRLIQAFQAGDYDNTEKLAMSLTQEFPKHQLAWKILGVVLGQFGRHSDALIANQTAITLSPQDAEAHYNNGNALKELGKSEEAEASYGKAIALKSDFVEAYSNLGVVLKELDRPEEAEESFRQAIALKGDFAEGHANLGNVLKELGRLDEAEASYRQAIDNDPNSATAYWALGEVLREQGKLRESSRIQIKSLEITSVETVSNSNLEFVIPKFVNKMQQQNGIATFFDHYVFSHLSAKSNLPIDICEIFEDGQFSKDNRFVFFSERVEATPASMPTGRLFDGIPFVSSQGIHSLIKWKEHSLYKTSFDIVLYWMILQEVKPDIIIELGSGEGGSAIWFADMAFALGLNTHVYSYDINKPKLHHERVTFIKYDLMTMHQESRPPYWKFFTGKKMVIEDAHVNVKNVLNLFDNVLSAGDYLIVEDSDDKQEVIRNFTREKEPKYQLDQFFLDFFGKNITCSKNSIFKVF